MDSTVPPLKKVLAKLPWFDELTAEHSDDLLDRLQELMFEGSTRDDYESLLIRFAEVAHTDAKWGRFAVLRENGLCTPD